MKDVYQSEIEAMRDFYNELGIIPDYSCNTDGCIKGTLIEIKLNTIGIPLKQLQRYIESRNSIALSLPRYSLFININQRKYAFIDNSSWENIIDGKWENPKDLLKFLNKDEYLKGWINEFSIVAYNDLFYDKYSKAVKKDIFIDEIKNPKILNIEPYNWNKIGNMERSILDCLGSNELKKRLGAFFTPDKYIKISSEYLRNAIKRVPEGYDYIILDRCAGTGNLEKFLTDEELSHCILNTYVYAEWTTLKGLYEGRVRYIIPHNNNYKDSNGLLSDGDALTEEFNTLLTCIIEKERKKVNGKLIVIGLENPPYAESQGKGIHHIKTSKQISWVKEQMKKEKLGVPGNDLVNQFIYSMTRNYCDEYIIFSPIKYWKSQYLFDGKFNEGYFCNRKYFHTDSDAAISLINWSICDEMNEVLNMDSDLGKRDVKKIYKGMKSFGFKNLSGGKPYNGFAYMASGPGVPRFTASCLTNEKIINKNFRNPVALIKLNILQAIPLWVANCYKSKDYTEQEVIMKSGDGGILYQKDEDFLNDCFIWTCLTDKNKCISNDQIKNELCLNQNTIADTLLNINKKNVNLLKIWNQIINYIKNTKEYNINYNYGLDQINKKINIKIETGGYNKKNKPILESKYPDLDFMIKELKEQLKEFYDKYITPKMFKYELLK